MGSSCPDKPKPPAPEADQKALFEAIDKHDVKTVESLLAAHSYQGVKNADGDTPLLHAIYAAPNVKGKRDSSIPCLLAAEKVDIETKGHDSKTPLHLTFDLRNSGGTVAGIIECLVNNGATLNEKIFDGRQPLEWSLDAPSAKGPKRAQAMSKLFITRVSKDSNETFEGVPTLIWAIRHPKFDIVGELIEAGADVNAPRIASTGNSALHEAVLIGRLDSIQKLLDAGANMDATNNEGQTPLHLAYKSGKSDVVELLKQKGADQTTRDNRHRLPSDYQVFSWVKWNLVGDLSPQITRLKNVLHLRCDPSNTSCLQSKIHEQDDCLFLYKKHDRNTAEELQRAKDDLKVKAYKDQLKSVFRDANQKAHKEKCAVAFPGSELEFEKCENEAPQKTQLLGDCYTVLVESATCQSFCRASRSTYQCVDQCRRPCMSTCESEALACGEGKDRAFTECQQDASKIPSECRQEKFDTATRCSDDRARCDASCSTL